MKKEDLTKILEEKITKILDESNVGLLESEIRAIATLQTLLNALNF